MTIQNTDIAAVITKNGFKILVGNSPTKDGFRVELKYADIYAKGVKKGRFPVKGMRLSGIGNQIRVRCVITSDKEKYFYDEIRLIDGLSNSEFAVLKHRTSGETIDYVAPHKGSTFNYNIVFTSVDSKSITIVTDDGNSTALLELDEHKADKKAHAELLEGKLNNSGEDTMRGRLEIQNPIAEKMRFTNKNDYYWSLNTEVPENSSNGASFSYIYKNTQDKELGSVVFPRVDKAENVAYRSWVEQRAVFLNGNQTINGNKTFNGTLESLYRIVIKRNESNYRPYQNFLDAATDIKSEIKASKVIGSIHFNVANTSSNPNGESTRASIFAEILSDKSGNLSAGAYSSSGVYKTGWAIFGESGNIRVGGGADNGKGSLQIGGNTWTEGNYIAGNTDWPKLQLCSKRGDQALLVESGGNAGTHKLIVRPHVNGVVSGSNIAAFALPNVTGEKTLATMEDVARAAAAGAESVKLGKAIGLGKNHNIAIGWDTPGLIAKVDQTFINVGIPSGTIIYITTDVVPFGFLKANAAEVGRKTFPTLFAAIGTRYGAGDGSTTFNLPDGRAEFPFGWDDGRGVDVGRVLGSAQASHLPPHRHATGWLTGQAGNEFVSIRNDWGGVAHIANEVASQVHGQNYGDEEVYAHVSGSAHQQSRDRYSTSKGIYDVSGEVYPRNLALLAIIKI